MPSSAASKGRLLIKKCLKLLENHKRLFVFPILGYICKFLIYVAVITPFVHSREQLAMINHLTGVQIFLVVIVFMVMLFVINLVLFFFNTAIVANLLYFLRHKQEASIRFGFTQSFRRYFRVFLWAFYAGTFGVFFNLLPRSSQYKLKLESLLQKNHWRIASYFCLAIVMDQGIGPYAALKHSSELMGKLWGDNLRPNFSLSGLFVAFELPCFIGFILACIYGSHATILGVGIAAGFIILLTSSFYQMINTTLRAVSYCYAQYGIETDVFGGDLIQKLFVQRL